MLIRKLFKGEMSHIVRNATAKRCSHSIHGHSFIVEVFLSSSKLDNAGMICDFHLLKNIKEFIDTFDHCHVLWTKDKKEYRDFIKEENSRWIELQVNPSAENLALLMLYWCQEIVKETEFTNGEGEVTIEKVRYHETTTGYAEATKEDIENTMNSYLASPLMTFSPDILTEMSKELYSFFTDFEQKDKFFTNPQITLQCQPN